MATSHRGFIRQARSPKRLTQWGLGPGSTVATSLSGSSSSLLGGGIEFGSAGTVVRIRGWISVFLTSYTSAGNGFHCAAAIGLVAKPAFDVGIASLPTPITDAAWDGWMWHTYFDVHGALAAGSANTGNQNGGFDMAVDTKAMRKVSDEMIIFAAIQGVELGTAVLDTYLETWLLLKLG